MSASIFYFNVIKKPKTLDPYELGQERDDFLDGVEVTELFNNDVPHVRHERVIKPTGLPPEDWRIE